LVDLYYNKNDDSNRNSSTQILSELYPDPKSLPTPPALREPIPSVTLSKLEPGKYVSTTARVAYIRTAERHDALGEKVVFTGVLEDSKASMIKHPCQKTPKSVIFYARKIGKRRNPMLFVLD
jgi:hypothetical protein